MDVYSEKVIAYQKKTKTPRYLQREDFEKMSSFQILENRSYFAVKCREPILNEPKDVLIPMKLVVSKECALFYDLKKEIMSLALLIEDYQSFVVPPPGGNHIYVFGSFDRLSIGLVLYFLYVTAYADTDTKVRWEALVAELQNLLTTTLQDCDNLGFNQLGDLNEIAFRIDASNQERNLLPLMAVVESAQLAYKFFSSSPVLLVDKTGLEKKIGYIAGYAGKYVIIGYYNNSGCVTSFSNHKDICYDDKYETYRFAKMSRIVMPDKTMSDYESVYQELWKEVVSI